MRDQINAWVVVIVTTDHGNIGPFRSKAQAIEFGTEQLGKEGGPLDDESQWKVALSPKRAAISPSAYRNLDVTSTEI